MLTQKNGLEGTSQAYRIPCISMSLFDYLDALMDSRTVTFHVFFLRESHRNISIFPSSIISLPMLGMRTV